MLREDTPYYVLVDLNTKGLCNLLRNSGTTIARIASLHLDDGLDELFGRTLWFRFSLLPP